MKTHPIIPAILLLLVLWSCNEERSSTDIVNIQEDTSKNPGISLQNKNEIVFESYCNQKYGFCVDFPRDILFPQGESESSDGQVFKSKDAENTFWVYRDFRDEIDPDIGYSIEIAYNEDAWGDNPDKPKRVVTYKKLYKESYDVSGYDNGKIFYQKTIMRKGMLYTCLFEYQEKEKKLYDKFIIRMCKTFL